MVSSKQIVSDSSFPRMASKGGSRQAGRQAISPVLLPWNLQLQQSVSRFVDSQRGSALPCSIERIAVVHVGADFHPMEPNSEEVPSLKFSSLYLSSYSISVIDVNIVRSVPNPQLCRHLLVLNLTVDPRQLPKHGHQQQQQQHHPGWVISPGMH